MRSETQLQKSNLDSLVFDALTHIFTFLNPETQSPVLRLVSSQWRKADKEAHGDFFSRALLICYRAHFAPVVYRFYDPLLKIKYSSWFFHCFARNPFYAFPHTKVLKSLPTLCNLTEIKPSQITQKELYSIAGLSDFADHVITESKTRGMIYIPKGAFRKIAIGFLFLLLLSSVLVPLILLILRIGMKKTNPNVFTSKKNISCESFEKSICHIADKVTEAILTSCREMTCNAFHHDRDRFITKNIMVTCRDKIIDQNSYTLTNLFFMLFLAAPAAVLFLQMCAFLLYALVASAHEFIVEKIQAYPEQLGWIKRSYDHFDEKKTIARKELDGRLNSSQRFFRKVAGIARSQLNRETRIVPIPDSESGSFRLKIE